MSELGVGNQKVVFWIDMKQYFANMKEITSSKLIILVTMFLIIFGNVAFFSNVTDVYPVNLKNVAFLGSLALLFSSITILLLSLVCYKHTIKPVLIAILFISSVTSYFMDSYNVTIDESMIQNMVNTDMAESLDLITFKMILYVTLLGAIPSIYLYKVNIVYADVKQEIVSRIKLFLLSLLLIISVIFVFGSFYASFLREHKPLRYYANPFNSTIFSLQ